MNKAGVSTMDCSSLPELIFSSLGLRQLISQSVSSGSLIVTDEHNFPSICDLATSVKVYDQEFYHIEDVRTNQSYEDVIAVGGCTALDFGRACAVGKSLIAIPTILSTSCLSTNCSVIKRNGIYRSERTQAPLKTLISMPTIVHNHADTIRKWSISGLGDLFAAVSTSIELEYTRSGRTFTQADILNNIPAVAKAMDWVDGPIQTFDETNLRMLATYLHEASVDIIRFGKMALNAASEHWLYYKMQERWNYPKMIATHGKLVSIGTLISCRIFAESIEDDSLFRRMRGIHRKLGLPYNLTDLNTLGVQLEHIKAGLKDLSNLDCMYRDYFVGGDYSIVTRALGD